MQSKAFPLSGLEYIQGEPVDLQKEYGNHAVVVEVVFSFFLFFFAFFSTFFLVSLSTVLGNLVVSIGCFLKCFLFSCFLCFSLFSLFLCLLQQQITFRSKIIASSFCLHCFFVFQFLFLSKPKSSLSHIHSSFDRATTQVPRYQSNYLFFPSVLDSDHRILFSLSESQQRRKRSLLLSFKRWGKRWIIALLWIPLERSRQNIWDITI
jgi:hypothetical protein